MAEKTLMTAKGYLCLICSRSRTDLTGIKQHLQDSHMDTGVRYRCPICRNIYKTKNSFQNHISLKHREELRGMDQTKCIVYE